MLISCGRDHSAMIKIDGSLWVTGANSMRQLGIRGWHGGIFGFTRIATPSPCVALGCGQYSTMYISAEGYLWSAGDNNHGQLGLGDGHPLKYERVREVPLVCRISCGYRHTLVIANDGTLWATGDNTKGQLGTGDTINRKLFVRIGDFTDIISVYCGNEVSIITRKDDSRWGAGSNFRGRIGIEGASIINTFTRIPYLPSLRPIHKKSRNDEEYFEARARTRV